MAGASPQSGRGAGLYSAPLSYPVQFRAESVRRWPLTADTWVLVPAAAGQLALARAWPNPARAGVSVPFVLPASAPVTLEPFDIAGRRVWSQRYDGPVPGPHSVALDAPRGRRSGVYLLRLTQAGRSRSTRIVWVR